MCESYGRRYVADAHSRPPAALSSLAVTTKMVQMAEDLLDVAEVAALLKLRPVTIYRWCRAGRLPGVKIGKEWRIPRAALIDLLPGAWRHDPGRNDEDLAMDEVSPAAWALARRLLLYEAGGREAPEAATAAAGRAHERLRGRLAGVIGAIGFATLFARAQRLAQAEFPALARLAFGDGAGEPPGGRARPAADEADAATVAAGLTALFATFIGLLGAFIGEELALRLIRDAWPEVADDAFGVVRAEERG